MRHTAICKSTDHLFLPVLEVHIPLLRCVHCNVFAYHDTVKQLAKKRAYKVDEEEDFIPLEAPYWQKLWIGFRRVVKI